MKIHYHGDFDGLSGAVILADFFINGLERKDVCWDYVVYSYSNDWQHKKLTGTDNAVIDFPFHEDADWWFDHHETSFGEYSREFVENHKSTPYSTKPDYTNLRWDPEKRKYDQIVEENLPQYRYPHKYWKYDKQANSAAQVVLDYLKDTFDYHNRAFDEMMHWANIIDSANYESSEQANDLTCPYIKFNSIMEYYPKKDANLNSIVGLFLQGKSINEIIEVDFCKEIIDKMNAKIIKGREIISKHGTYKNDIFYSFVEEERDDYAFPRYWWYNIENCKYHVVCLNQGDNYVYRVGKNPFIKFEDDINFGEICQKYGGGGHAAVGAIIYKGNNPRKIYEEIIDMLEE